MRGNGEDQLCTCVLFIIRHYTMQRESVQLCVVFSCKQRSYLSDFRVEGKELQAKSDVHWGFHLTSHFCFSFELLDPC